VEVSDSEETVRDSLVISVVQTGPVLHVEPDSLDFSSTLITLAFYITNSGTETLTWSASDDQTWISLDSNAGSTTAETDSVLVTILRGVLSPGVYEGLIEVTSNGGNLDVAVRMRVSGEINYTYSVVNQYPHDTQAFTQGLVFHDGFLYEGTGRRGASSVRRVDIETGDVLQIRNVPRPYFGEGITIFGDQLLQLTWESQVGFIYDRDSFDSLGVFSYPTDGWGLTHDGASLIMSDGTSHLYFMNPETFERTADVRVVSNAGSVWRLNELEYIEGEVFANVWLSDRIVRIDPGTGEVTGWIDLSGLLTPEEAVVADVLNGIAWDEENERLFVTGKLWPWVFEIELIEAD
jgi:glutamine cyclotransferase